MDDHTQKGVLSDANFAGVFVAELQGVGIKTIGRNEIGALHEVNFRYLAETTVTVSIALATYTRNIGVHYRAPRYAERKNSPSMCRYLSDPAGFDPILFETAVRVLKEEDDFCGNVVFPIVAVPDAGCHSVFRVVMHALKILHEECSKP